MTISRTIALAAASAALLVGVTQAQAENLIPNGSFEQGNTGFTSQYTYQPPPQGPYNPDGLYNTSTSAGDAGIYPTWKDSGVTAQDGKMALFADGANNAAKFVWSTTVTGLKANTDYTFSFYGASLVNFNNPTLGAFLNGASLGSLQTTYGAWTMASFTFNSGATSNFQFSINDLRTESNANDFGLDNISLRAVPGPIAGAGLPALLALGGALLMRRRKLA